MRVYGVIVPYQNDMGSINPFTVTSSSMESAKKKMPCGISTVCVTTTA